MNIKSQNKTTYSWVLSHKPNIVLNTRPCVEYGEWCSKKSNWKHTFNNKNRRKKMNARKVHGIKEKSLQYAEVIKLTNTPSFGWSACVSFHQQLNYKHGLSALNLHKLQHRPGIWPWTVHTILTPGCQLHLVPLDHQTYYISSLHNG